MTELLELAETRVVEAQQQVEAAAKRAKTKRRTVPPSKKSLKRRGATTTLDESLQTLQEVEEERACLRAATDAMCLGFDRIQQVPALPCPYCQEESQLITAESVLIATIIACMAGHARKI